VFVVLGIRHSKHMRLLISSSVPCPTVPHFSTLPHKQYNFRKESLNTKRVFRFSVQVLSETFLVLRGTEGDMIKNVHRYSCKVPVILVKF
jgi:hypothetical protein